MLKLSISDKVDLIIMSFITY